MAFQILDRLVKETTKDDHVTSLHDGNPHSEDDFSTDVALVMTSKSSGQGSRKAEKTKALVLKEHRGHKATLNGVFSSYHED